MQPLPFDILGIPAQLARPDRWPLLLLVLVAASLAAYSLWSRRRTLLQLAATPRLLEKVAPGASIGGPLGRALLSLGGLLLIGLALLEPQLGQRNEKVQRQGIDLVVAIDASRSMLARDVLPSRLERARLELAQLIDRLQGDRVGLVVFAGQAFVQCPLTSDYGAAKLFLRAVDPGSMPAQGTALADALQTAGTMLQSADRGAKTKVVLLLSDGEDHEGDVDGAAEALRAQGVRVFALGVGSAEGTPVPVLDERGDVRSYLRDRGGNPVVTRLEEAQLRRVAEITGGSYLAARGGDLGMGEVYAALDALEKSEFESHLAMRWGDAWYWLGFPGFALLLLGAVIPAGRRRA
jgi:Ca-activated chloride channel family protein